MVKKRRNQNKKQKHESHERSDADDSITINKTTLWQAVSGILAIMFIVVLATGGFFGGSTGAVTTQDNQPSANNQEQPTREFSYDIDNARTKGDPDASVVMVEYSSFTCPFCGRHAEQTKPQLMEEFVDTGDVFYVYKHFPRSAEDVRIIQSAECAGEQDVFFDYIPLIYQNQQSGNSDAALRGYAEDLGLDMAEFDSCVESGRYEDLAQEHLREGQANGVRGTPGFIVGEELVSGAQPYSVFAGAINSQLN